MLESKDSFEPAKSDTNSSFSDTKALKLKVEYTLGTELGKDREGRVEPVETVLKFGKSGLGYKIEGIDDHNLEWDFNLEEIVVEQKVEWLPNKLPFTINLQDMQSWIAVGPHITNVENEAEFCDSKLLKQIIEAKDIFNKLDENELYKARAKANPFETIKSVFFMNRAALKMANIDAATQFMFTDIGSNEHHKRHQGPFYFADVCAGPGGFTEYVLWRNRWSFKGFGLTLKGENDFDLQKSVCAPTLTFNALYGAKGDGNVYCLENILDFKERVLHETNNLGVHFMMADGGFSVEGKENLQEVLSKQLYVCQCLVALEIVRPFGHFVTKLFDTYTVFTIGLLFLMYKCFEKVSVFKPNTSRPANSERYLICQSLIVNDQTKNIKEHLTKVVQKLWDLRISETNEDINEIVPLEVIKADTDFLNYIVDTNNRLGRKQLIALKKMTTFCYNPSLVEFRQEELRKRSLNYWKIPDHPKVKLPFQNLENLLLETSAESEFINVQPREVSSLKQIKEIIDSLVNWHYVFLTSSKTTQVCSFYAGVDESKVYKLCRNKWIRVKNVHLIRGTLLYGEMVNETSIQKTENDHKEIYRQSLHVIDALRLGDSILENKSFDERLKMIETYCEAINHESRDNNYVRIRAKQSGPLTTLFLNNSFTYDASSNNYISDVVILGLDSIKEFYTVNSILLLKTDDNQSFTTTYVLRIQLFIKEESNACNILEEFQSFLDSGNKS